MNLTRDIVEEIQKLTKAYDETSDITRRKELGVKIDNYGEVLSDKQIIQVVKILSRR